MWLVAIVCILVVIGPSISEHVCRRSENGCVTDHLGSLTRYAMAAEQMPVDRASVSQRKRTAPERGTPETASCVADVDRLHW
jgi:hypothetical protein